MATGAVPASSVVKDEPEDAPEGSKKKRRAKDDDVTKAKDAGNLVPKKKDEDQAEEGAGEEEPGDDDAMAPEAEPSFPRNEVPPGTSKFREDAVHVYGLDFLKTGHMEEIFGQFRHRYIEWINLSSANVVFKDKESARKALESLSYPKVGDDPWRRTPDILVHDDLPAVYLQMRLAAACDAKPKKHGIPSANPPVFIEESERGRNSQFTVSSLYEKKPKSDRGSQKRGPQGLPEEEFEKRKKRGERFKETLGPPPEAPKPVAPEEKPAARDEKETVSSKPSAEEPTPEEDIKRQKRAERFDLTSKPAVASDSKDKPTKTDVTTSASVATASEPVVDKALDSEKPASDGTSQTAKSTSIADESAKDGKGNVEK
mmetsp:Transcript_68676/g.108958  ORF Transcript_68676/g.108958 Transcript_68676/m.108958 type:complete len:372 (+) Transcript_68676:148-1263(+)